MSHFSTLRFRNFDPSDFIWVADSHVLEIDDVDVYARYKDFSGSDYLEIESPLTGSQVVLQADEIRFADDDSSYVAIYRPLTTAENFEVHLYCE